MTPNGKLDRRALPAPDGAALVDQAIRRAPRRRSNRRIAADLAGLAGPRTGRPPRPLLRARRPLADGGSPDRAHAPARLGLDVSTVFAAPTLAAMAAAVAAAHAASTDFVAPPNLIPAGCDAIRPDMLPLVDLTASRDRPYRGERPAGRAEYPGHLPARPAAGRHPVPPSARPASDAYRLRSALVFDSRQPPRRLPRRVAASDRPPRYPAQHNPLGRLSQAVQLVLRHAQLPVTEVRIEAGGDASAQFLALHRSAQGQRLRSTARRCWHAFVAADPDSGEWLLALLHHHIVCDHVTVELMMTELQVLLHHGGERLAPSLPYRNFIAQTLAPSGRRA